MKKLSILLYIMFGCIIQAFSQKTNTRTLEVGDKVPDIEFTSIINYSSKRALLSDFKDKLVILDFWATWCINCIATFPKLDYIQRKFPDQLQILLVNAKSSGDDEKKVKTFFETSKNRNGTMYLLPSAINDTLAKRLFEHTLIPHCVWINKGIVSAITSSDEVTEENIEKVLSDNAITLETKRDINADKPLFTIDELPMKEIIHYSIFSKGRYNGLPAGTRFRKGSGDILGVAFTNSSLLQIYKAVGMALLDGFDDKKIILSISDSSAFIPPSLPEQKDKWFRNNLYNYDLILPCPAWKNLYQCILSDLNRYSGYEGRIKKIKMKCFTLHQNGDIKEKNDQNNLHSNKPYKEPNTFRFEGTIENFVSEISQMKNITPIILNETGYSERVKIELPNKKITIQELQKLLVPYNLELKEAERMVEVLIISEK